ncbi:MAG: DUF4286 family protein [Bacteroidales bacterium]|nr:DUF4286 family protein [Bacteroidales bacterium]
MYIINTTFAVVRELEAEFTKWVKEVYIPSAMKSGLFSNPRLAVVLSNEDPRGISMACEMQVESISEAVRWHDETACFLRDDMTARWGERAMFFTTYLKLI